MYTLLFITFVLATGFWGYYKGSLKVLLRLLTILFAYTLAWQGTSTVAHFLTLKHWLPGVFVWPVAAGALFVGGSLFFSLLASLLVYVAPDEWKQRGKGLGAAMGCLLGSIIGLFLLWTAGVAQEAILKRQQTQAGIESSPDAFASKPAPPEHSTTDQILQSAATEMISRAATAIMGDSPTASLAGEIARSPISVGEGFKHLAEQPELRLLLQDPESYATLTHGTPDDVLRLPHFRALVTDTELMRFLGTTGLTGATPAEQERDLATKLSTYARNFETLRHTPEYQALAADPDFQNQLKTGQWLQLLTNEKARELAEILVNPEALAKQQDTQDASTRFTVSAPGQTEWNSTAHGSKTDGGSDNRTDTETTKTIYRWRDPKGRIHLTDEKPPEGTPYDELVQ